MRRDKNLNSIQLSLLDNENHLLIHFSLFSFLLSLSSGGKSHGLKWSFIVSFFLSPLFYRSIKSSQVSRILVSMPLHGTSSKRRRTSRDRRSSNCFVACPKERCYMHTTLLSLTSITCIITSHSAMICTSASMKETLGCTSSEYLTNHATGSS